MDSWSEEQQPLLGVMAPTTHPQPVKTYDLGTIDADGYGKVLGFSQQQSYEEVPGTTNNNVPPARRKRVIIVGAGISGIQQASTLLRGGQVRHEDMVIFDTQDHYGGVWEKNKYPGCACDVPAMLYTTSYFVNKGMCPIAMHCHRPGEFWGSRPSAGPRTDQPRQSIRIFSRLGRRSRTTIFALLKPTAWRPVPTSSHS